MREFGTIDVRWCNTDTAGGPWRIVCPFVDLNDHRSSIVCCVVISDASTTLNTVSVQDSRNTRTRPLRRRSLVAGLQYGDTMSNLLGQCVRVIHLDASAHVVPGPFIRNLSTASDEFHKI